MKFLFLKTLAIVILKQKKSHLIFRKDLEKKKYYLHISESFYFFFSFRFYVYIFEISYHVALFTITKFF